jgi:hypothetical protein
VVGIVERMFDVERIEPGVSPAGLMDRLCGHLAVMAPGAELAGMLESVDLAGLSGHERVMVLRGWSRQLAHVQARLLEAMVAVAGAVAAETRWGDEQTVFDLAASEIGAGLSWTRRAAEYHLGFAQDLVDRYPRVWEALDSGHIDLPRTRVLVEQTRHLPSELCDRVCEQVLDKASNQTTGQLRARLQRLVIAVDPDSARKRYETGLARRRVISEPTETGTASLLGLDLPAAESSSAMRRINRLARTMKKTGDIWTMDQIRGRHLPRPAQRTRLSESERRWRGRHQGRPHHPDRARRQPGRDPRLGPGHRRGRP